MLIQAIKIFTLRFGENLRMGMIQGEASLNCENMKQIHVMICEIVRHKKE